MGSKLSTRLVTGYSTIAGRLLTTLRIVHPVISTSLDSLRSTWLARNWTHMLMWNNLPLDTNFFSAVMEALVPQWTKCLEVNSDYMEVWYIPCATHGGFMCTMCNTWQSDVYHVQHMVVWCVPCATHGSLMCTRCNTWQSGVYHVQHMTVWCVPCATRGSLMCTMCNTRTTHISESE